VARADSGYAIRLSLSSVFDFVRCKRHPFAAIDIIYYGFHARDDQKAANSLLAGMGIRQWNEEAGWAHNTCCANVNLKRTPRNTY
jgi:hypothetical protein